ncbi:MAG: hypothetical protein HQM14_18470 [SAR324 cluster bacterium]|nr:hypothetical protein [SAR324 cluster bacterium]
MQKSSKLHIIPLLSVFGLTSIFLFFHFFALSSVSRSFDSAVLKAGVERVYWLGGDFYTTMFTHKGPLWSWIHLLAYSIGKADYFWEAVGFLILVVAILKGVLLFLCTRIVVKNRWFRFSFVLLVVLYLLSGVEEFSYRLYSRNLSELFLLIAATVIWLGYYYKRDLILVAMVSAVFLGQAVLIMPTAAISGSMIAVFFLWELKTSLNASNQNLSTTKLFLLVSIVFISLGLLSILSTPLWYWNKGEFSEFWNGWYVYNTFYTDATNRSFWQILEKGIEDFARHRINLSQLFIYFFDFFLLIHVTLKYRKENRLFCRMLWTTFGWCLGGIFQVILSQRFFGHYLICFVFPLLILNCLLALYYFRSFEQKPVWLIIPSIIYLLGSVSLSGKTIFVGVKQFSNFDFYHDPQTHADRVNFNLFQKVNVVQHYTDPGEFIYFWGGDDSREWEHYQRIHATRYIEQRWLIGRIYGGGIQQKWVLPGTWQKWENDMVATPPKAIVVETPSHIDASDVKVSKYPRFERILKEKYQLAYSDQKASIFIENRRMQERKSRDLSLPQNHYLEDCEGKEFSIHKKEGKYQISYAIRSRSNSRHFLIEVDQKTLQSHPYQLYFFFKQISGLHLEIVNTNIIRLHWEFFNKPNTVCQAKLIS